MKNVSVIFRLSLEKKKQLQIEAVKKNTTIQALMESAVNEILKKEGQLSPSTTS